MIIILVCLSFIFVILLLIIRNYSNEKYISAIDLAANMSAALIGVFFALVADDYRKKNDEKTETVHALLAAQAGIIESTRSLRETMQPFVNFLAVQDADQKKFLLRDFDKVANNEPMQASQIGTIFLSNSDLLRSVDNPIIYFIVRKDALLARYAHIYNSQKIDNTSRANSLYRYLIAADDISMHLCIYRSFTEDKINKTEYDRALDWEYDGRPPILDVFIKSNCQPRATSADFVKWLFDSASTSH